MHNLVYHIVDIFDIVSNANREPKWHDSTKQKFTFRCPVPAHVRGDQNPSAFCALDDKDVPRFHCSSCGATSEQIATALNLPSDYWKTTNEQPHGCTLLDLATKTGLSVDYLTSQGLTDSTWQGNPAVLFPYPGGAQRYRVNLTDGQRFAWAKGTNAKPQIYITLEGNDWITKSDYLIVVEGETDTITLNRATLPAVGLPGVSFLNEFTAAKIANYGKRVYLWIEDQAGHQLVKNALKHLQPLGVDTWIIYAGSATTKLDANQLFHDTGCDTCKFAAAVSELMQKSIPLAECTRGGLEKAAAAQMDEILNSEHGPAALALIGVNDYASVINKAKQVNSIDDAKDNFVTIMTSVNNLRNAYPLLQGPEQITVDEVARNHRLGRELIHKLTLPDGDVLVHNALEYIRCRLMNAESCRLFAEVWAGANEQQRYAITSRAQLLYSVQMDELNRMLEAGQPMTEVESFDLSELADTALPMPSSLPVLGSFAEAMFFRGASHLVVASPGVGKTRMVAQTVLTWGMETHYITEDNKMLWKHYADEMASAGLAMPYSFHIHVGAAPLDILKQTLDGGALIIDTVRSAFHIQDEFASTEFEASIRPIVDECRQRNITLVLVHHSRKSGGLTAVDASSGTNALPGMVDIVMMLTGKNGNLTLAATKTRYGRPAKIGIKWENNRMVTTAAAVDDDDEATSFDDEVLSTLDGYTITKKSAIAKNLGVSESKVLRALKALQDSGIVKNIGAGRSSGWILAPEDDPGELYT